uniref:uncharacterized protein LOC127069174 n=1 Tax=Vespula vulgaris TaxID=7454 RepID=UPI00223B5C9A|nr:uncharacterized protein LOC127069174 [Vespula vulgaris]
MKKMILIIIFFLLLSRTSSFGRHRMHKLKKDEDVCEKKINDTLLEIHESLDTWLNDTEAVILLRNICNFAFKHYSLREINGKRYICDHVPGSTLVTSSGDGLWETHLRDNCHEYLNEIDPLELYQHWQQWCQDDHKNPDLVTILCRNDAGKLRDCRSMDDMIKYELPSKNYQTDIKIKVEFGC